MLFFNNGKVGVTESSHVIKRGGAKKYNGLVEHLD